MPQKQAVGPIRRGLQSLFRGPQAQRPPVGRAAPTAMRPPTPPAPPAPPRSAAMALASRARPVGASHSEAEDTLKQGASLYTAALVKLAQTPPAATSPPAPNYNVRTSHRAPVQATELAGWMNDLSRNSGEDLRDVDVRIGPVRRPFRDALSIVTPRTVSDIPRAVLNLHPRRFIPRFLDAVVAPQDGSYYSHDTNHVQVGTADRDKGTLAHEVGHRQDFNGRGVYPRSRFLGLPDSPIHDFTLSNEMAATMWARRGLGPEWKKYAPSLEAAFGTYVDGHLQTRHPMLVDDARTWVEFARGQPKLAPYDGDLPEQFKAFQREYQTASTNARRRLAVRRALIGARNAAMDRGDFPSVWSSVPVTYQAGDGSKLRPIDKARPSMLLSKVMLQLEEKRLAREAAAKAERKP